MFYTGTIDYPITETNVIPDVDYQVEYDIRDGEIITDMHEVSLWSKDKGCFEWVRPNNFIESLIEEDVQNQFSRGLIE